MIYQAKPLPDVAAYHMDAGSCHGCSTSSLDWDSSRGSPWNPAPAWDKMVTEI